MQERETVKLRTNRAEPDPDRNNNKWSAIWARILTLRTGEERRKENIWMLVLFTYIWTWNNPGSFLCDLQLHAVFPPHSNRYRRIGADDQNN